MILSKDLVLDSAEPATPTVAGAMVQQQTTAQHVILVSGSSWTSQFVLLIARMDIPTTTNQDPRNAKFVVASVKRVKWDLISILFAHHVH